MPHPDIDDPWKAATLTEFESAPSEASWVEMPSSLTASGRRFFVDLSKAMGVFVLLVNVVVFSDNARLVAQKLSKKFERVLEQNTSGIDESLPHDFDPFVPLSGGDGIFASQFRNVKTIVFEMILARIIDNFGNYLSEIMRECLKAKPQIMRSKETISYEAVFEHDNIEELREALIDRKVNELAYKGFSQLSEWFDDRLGIKCLQAFPAKLTLLECMEARHCIVHNRSSRSAKMLKTIGKAGNRDLVGTPIKVDVDLIYLAGRATAECVSMLDNVLAEKFDLERRSHGA